MFEHFEHRADIGVRGFGATLAEAFQETAKAMFAVMGKIESVNKKKKVKIFCNADDEAGLLIEFLNALLAQADIEKMFFSDFQVKIKKGKKYELTGYAIGEKRDVDKHCLKLEVKAATYSQLKVEKKEGFMAQCIVDV
jgi:SHS2 domain-containing protein